MATQLGHARFEGSPCSGAAEEKQHCQHFVPQVCMLLSKCSLPFKIKGNIEDGFNLLFAEI
jgi:hypothetical protein